MLHVILAMPEESICKWNIVSSSVVGNETFSDLYKYFLFVFIFIANSVISFILIFDGFSFLSLLVSKEFHISFGFVNNLCFQK